MEHVVSVTAQLPPWARRGVQRLTPDVPIGSPRHYEKSPSVPSTCGPLPCPSWSSSRSGARLEHPRSHRRSLRTCVRTLCSGAGHEAGPFQVAGERVEAAGPTHADVATPQLDQAEVAQMQRRGSGPTARLSELPGLGIVPASRPDAVLSAWPARAGTASVEHRPSESGTSSTTSDAAHDPHSPSMAETFAHGAGRPGPSVGGGRFSGDHAGVAARAPLRSPRGGGRCRAACGSTAGLPLRATRRPRPGSPCSAP